MAPSEQLQKTVAYAPKVGAVLSLIGSGYIVYDCYRKIRQRNNRHRGGGGGLQQQQQNNSSRQGCTFQRLMMGVSIGDILYSTSFFAGTWPMPVATPYAWGAMGTVQSCTFFGVLTQGGVTGVLYNASLSVYYLLRIRQNWPESKIEKHEWWMLHAVPIAFGVISQALMLFYRVYNSNGFVCYAASAPRGCKESWQYGPEEANCVRGDNGQLFRYAFTLGPKVLAVFFVAAILLLVYCSVRKQERATIRWSVAANPSGQPTSFMVDVGGHNRGVSERSRDDGSGGDGDGDDSGLFCRLTSRWSSSCFARHKKAKGDSIEQQLPKPKLRLSRRLAVQSYFYVGALYVSYLPPLISRVLETITKTKPYWVVVLLGILLPIQGFWNVLVYLRPRYIQARRLARKKSSNVEVAAAGGNGTWRRSSRNILDERLSVIEAISYAVRQGDLENEEEDDDDDDDDEVFTGAAKQQQEQPENGNGVQFPVDGDSCDRETDVEYNTHGVSETPPRREDLSHLNNNISSSEHPATITSSQG